MKTRRLAAATVASLALSVTVGTAAFAGPHHTPSLHGGHQSRHGGTATTIAGAPTSTVASSDDDQDATTSTTVEDSESGSQHG